MEIVSIILTTRHSTESNDVEVTGECEKKYYPVALAYSAAKVTDAAKEFGGRMIPWVREPEFQKFCYAFRFETEERKRGFLKKLSEFA